MDKIVALLDELFTALDGVESPLLIAELVLSAVMMHRLRSFPKSAANESATSDAAVASSDPVVSVPEVAPAPTVSEEQKKEELKKALFNDIDLIFSDKPADSLTADQCNRLSVLLEYMRSLK